MSQLYPSDSTFQGANPHYLRHSTPLESSANLNAGHLEFKCLGSQPSHVDLQFAVCISSLNSGGAYLSPICILACVYQNHPTAMKIVEGCSFPDVTTVVPSQPKHQIECSTIPNYSPPLHQNSQSRIGGSVS